MSVFFTRRGKSARVNYVEYIQSNGTQFIDTLFKPNNNTRVVMDMQGATTTSGVYMHYGTVSGSLNFMAGKASSSSWDLYAYYNTAEQKLATKTVSDFAVRTVFDQNKNAITVGGVSYTFAAASFSLSNTMYLFGVNSNGSPSFLSPIKLYSCQIYDNGTLVRDLWPCYDPDGVACLYDKVEKKYYYNAGTGEFVTEGSEEPVVYANVNITGTAVHGGIAHASVTINGTSYTAAAVVSVPVGTVITLQARGSQYGIGTIKVNGSVVKSGSTGYMTYDYTVAGDVTIKLSGGTNSVSYVEVTTG